MSSRPVRALLERDTVVRCSPEDTVRSAVKTMAEHVCGSKPRHAGRQASRHLHRARPSDAGGVSQARPGSDHHRRGDDARSRHDRGGRRMDEFSYRYLPVIEDGKVIGMISTRHLPFGDVVATAGELQQRHDLAERMR